MSFVRSLELFEGHLSLSAGVYGQAAGDKVIGPMRKGLKVAVLIDGSQQLSFDENPPVSISGPTLLVALNEGDHIQERVSLSDQTLRCALVQIESGFAEHEFGAALEALARRSRPDMPKLWVRTATPVFRTLALQMAECRIEEPLCDLYLAGKALELVAVALHEIATEHKAARQRLSPRTIEQIHAARDLLIAAGRRPPSLAELARETGLSTTKLTSGFRGVFGRSVFAYLQEHRLQQAHEMIRTGEKTIAEAAFDVGYSPAHFSNVFRSRFGVPPSSLKAGHPNPRPKSAMDIAAAEPDANSNRSKRIRK